MFDPVSIPHRYRAPEDIEVVALVAACLAYGRADRFTRCIEEVVGRMIPTPSRFAESLARAPNVDVFSGIRYRFNQPDDLAALVAGIGWMRLTHNGLGARFKDLFAPHGMRSALAIFAEEIREAPPVLEMLRGGSTRGFRFLIPDARGPGACKRLNLYLRWMVRGPDQVDFGLWNGIRPKDLLIPLDTHVARVSRAIGLTNRSDLSWRTAEEITGALSAVDPTDPTRFDFALCHYAMSGQPLEQLARRLGLDRPSSARVAQTSRC